MTTSGEGEVVGRSRPARIGVVTLTYRRVGDLGQALPGLIAQVEAVPGAELVVIDNDVVPSAREVVEQHSLRHRVRYVHEPRPGIAAARNRGLQECLSSDVVVFVDDDERPNDGWLRLLVDTYTAIPCTGVAGRVVSAFDGPIDPWIEAGRFFERLRHPTGTRLPVVATNNLLVDAQQVQEWGIAFDERFGLSGGSDTVFALEVARAGGSFVWCDEAVVVDVVPPERLTRQWVLRRAFRSGNTGSRAAVHMTGSLGARTMTRGRMAARGAVRFGGGAARLLLGTAIRNPAHQARGARTAARGAGMLAGAFGMTYSEYKRPSASDAATLPVSSVSGST